MGIQNISIGKATLAVEQLGSGSSILFLHAGIATRRMWDPQIFDEMEDAWNNGDFERVLDLEKKAFIVGLNRNREQLDSKFLSVCREMNRTKFQWEDVDVEYEDDASQDAQFLVSTTSGCRPTDSTFASHISTTQLMYSLSKTMQ